MKVTLDLWHQLINYNFKANSPIWTNDVHNRCLSPGVSWTGRSTAYQGDGNGEVDNHGGEFVLRSFTFVLCMLEVLISFRQQWHQEHRHLDRLQPRHKDFLVKHTSVKIGVFGFRENYWKFSGKRSYYVNWTRVEAEMVKHNWKTRTLDNFRIKSDLIVWWCWDQCLFWIW